MHRKQIENYYMHVGRIALDVVKQGGVLYIRVADYCSDFAATYTLDLQLVSVCGDTSIYGYAWATLQRNHRSLLERAGDFK